MYKNITEKKAAGKHPSSTYSNRKVEVSKIKSDIY